MSSEQDVKPTHHFGRGGAGNITVKSHQSPVVAPSSTPVLKSKNYTTGRGGTGNIVENSNPETARIAQDVDVPGIVLPENEVHTGRGGGGNVYKPTEQEREAHRENNKQIRSHSFTKDKSTLQGIKDKAKSMISSSKDPKEP